MKTEMGMKVNEELREEKQTRSEDCVLLSSCVLYM
jgi:hypothetical protein